MKMWLRLTLITMTVGGGFTGAVLTFQSLVNSQGQRFPNLLVMAVFLVLVRARYCQWSYFRARPTANRSAYCGTCDTDSLGFFPVHRLQVCDGLSRFSWHR